MPASRLAEIARKAPRFVWVRSNRALNGSLHRLETRRAGRDDAPLQHAPLLVLGAPRSGSTLLYQLLVERFDVGYLSNLHCRFYGAPSLVERALVRREAPPSSFTSAHGRTHGLLAPSECGEFWYRFFRRSPQYVPISEAELDAMQRLRAAVWSLAEASRRPLVFKNLVCSLRLAPIAAALPEALFVVIHRDLVANAESLLSSRRRIHGDYSVWWSAEPPEVERLRALPPHEQVVEQVRQIDALIERDRVEAGEHRFFDLSYEALCDDPRRAMAEVGRFAERNGTTLEPRREVPERFPRPRAAAIDSELHAKLVAYAGVAESAR